MSGLLCGNKISAHAEYIGLLTFINLGDVRVSEFLHVSDLSVYSLIRLHACGVFLIDELESDLQISR